MTDPRAVDWNQPTRRKTPQSDYMNFALTYPGQFREVRRGHGKIGSWFGDEATMIPRDRFQRALDGLSRTAGIGDKWTIGCDMGRYAGDATVFTCWRAPKPVKRAFLCGCQRRPTR